MANIDSKIPEGPISEKWTNYKAHQKLVNPANKRKLDIIVVGTGLAGASAAASLGEMGFKVLNFCNIAMLHTACRACAVFSIPIPSSLFFPSTHMFLAMHRQAHPHSS